MKTNRSNKVSLLRTIVPTASRLALWLTAIAVMIFPAHGATVTWVGNTSPNWTNNLNWSPTSLPVGNDQLSFIAAGTSGTLLTNDLASGLIFNGITYQSGGSGFTFSGNPFGLNGGITNANASAQVLSNAITLQANGTVVATGPVTLAGAVSGGFSLTKFGSGALILGSANSYGGSTIINAGTVRAPVSGALPSTANIVFTSATAATLDIQGSSQSLADLVYNNGATASITITGLAGSTLTVSPATLQISPLNPTFSFTNNMTGLGTFTYSNVNGTLNVNNGLNSASSATGTAAVSWPGTNLITAAALNIGNRGTGSGVCKTFLNLGSSNVFTVGLLGVGNSSSRGGGTLQFASGLVNPTLTIVGINGVPVTLNCGANDSTTINDSPVNVLDATTGTLNAQLGAVVIGRNTLNSGTSRGVNNNSSFKMGAGNLTAASMAIGTMNDATISGTYNINNTSLFSVTSGGTATVTNMTLATSGYTGPLNSSSKLTTSVSLTNGATLNATTIQKGTIATPSAGALAVTSQINWGDGTIGNIPGSGLGVTGVSLVLLGTATAHNLNISAGQAGAVDSVISGAGSLTKVGGGTLSLSGANTYSGSTIVSTGTLALASSGSITSPTIQVASNAVFDVSAQGTFPLTASQTIIGYGSVAGNVSAAAGAQIVPGGNAVAGTLTFSNDLTLNGQTLVLDLSANPAGGNDQINLGGALVLNANTVIAVNTLGGVLGVGTYTLMTYASINTNSFTLSVYAPRGLLNIGDNALTLTVSSSVGADLTWVGDGVLNNWDAQTTTNWLNGLSLDFFYPNDAVTFTDSGSASPAVNLTTVLSPNSVTVNASQNYTFSGPGQLTGAMPLNKNGSGNLTLSGANTFTGNTAIGGGTLTIDSSGTLGSGNYAGNITNNGAFNYASSATQNLSGVISGTGTVANSGSGALALLGTNIYTGDTTISAGTLAIGGTGTLGNGNYAGNITNNATFAFGSSTAQTLSGVISGTGLVVKSGTNTLTLTGANSHSGGTYINAGTVQLSGGNDRLLTNSLVGFLGTGTFNIGANNQTLSTLTFPNFAMTATILGSGGTLTINGPTDLQFGPGGTVTSALTPVVTDMSKLGNFIYDAPVNSFRVGIRSGGSNSGALGNVATVTLGTNNLIRAGTLVLVDEGGSSDGGAATLHLGPTNLIQVDAISIGMSSRSDATLDFAAGLVNPTVTIRNTNGVDPVTSWNLGRVATFATAGQLTFGATNNFSLGTLDAFVMTMTMGAADAGTSASRGGTENGIFSMGAGTLTVGTLTIGRLAGQTGSTITGPYAGRGTFTMNSAGGILNATNINLAESTIQATGAFTRTASGTLNLGDGTIRAQTIQLGTQSAIAGTYVVTATINWTNGTIRNLDAGTDLTISNGLTAFVLHGTGAHTFNIDSGRTGTVYQAMSGTGSITKTGAGTLMLAGANSYTGNTTVNQGTLVIAQPTIATNSTVTVVSGAVLQLDFEVTNAVTALVLNGVGQAAGFYNSNTSPAYIAGPGSLLIPSTIPTSPTNITFGVSGSTLALSWPADYLGWILQQQTNSLNTGIANNWADVPGSSSVTSTNFAIDPAAPTVFYRLRHP